MRHVMAGDSRPADTAITGEDKRIATLDIIRGVAVMGILAMNIVAFAMPEAAYLNPRAYGWWSSADFFSWLVGFVFIDGKMRGLFSFLFGASMLLVIERAEAAGESPADVHFSRMAWLLLFGLVHFYFIWWGDILSLYAPVGMLAWFFRRLAPRSLLTVGAGLILVQFVLLLAITYSAKAMEAAVAGHHASAEAAERWRAFNDGLGVPYPADLARELALYRGSFGGLVAHRFSQDLLEPLKSLFLYGSETLAYMLFGMATLKNGFLAGRWPRKSYGRLAMIGFGIGIPLYAFLAWQAIQSYFSVPAVFLYVIALSTLVRPPMILAIAALIILLAHHRGPIAGRVGAAGRAAFTNYLGTSIVMAVLFYGYGVGLFGHLSRAQLWLAVLPAWAIMLLWSKPWLDRYRYGPFEWLWRSLARRRIQRMRRAEVAARV